MEISGFHRFLLERSIPKLTGEQENPSYIGTINWLLLYATYINLIALVACRLNLPLNRLQFQMSFGQQMKLN